MPFINLQPQINLGDPSLAHFYRGKQANGGLTVGKPIVFDVTISETTKNMDGSIQFVKFLLSSQGREIFQKDGFKLLPITTGGNKTAMPNEISSLTVR